MKSKDTYAASLRRDMNAAFASGVGSVIDMSGRPQCRSLSAFPRRGSAVALAWQRAGRRIAAALKMKK